MSQGVSSPTRTGLRTGVRVPEAGPASAGPGYRAGWPLTGLLVLYPLWWALGMGTLILFVLTIPMVIHLLRRPQVTVPPGFGLWLLFLAWAVASTALLSYDPPGVVDAPASGRLVSVIFTMACYLAATVVLLYAGNLSEEEFPRQRLVRQLGGFFCIVVAGGLLGVLAPHFQFTSLVEMLLSPSVRQNGFVRSLVHPAAAQLQGVLGFDSPRPAAPFGFTNMWGNCLALLLGWFVIGWLRSGSRSRRIVGVVILAAAAVPAVYSLNRGMWLGLGVALLFVLVRLAVRGRLAAVAAVVGAAVVIAALLVATPLATIVQERLDHPHSNEARTFTTERTLEVVSYSPVLGFGAPRAAQGSGASISAGPSTKCPSCGGPPLGSNGQLWAVLIAHGFVGVLLFVGFFLRSLWTYRHDRTAIGDAGLLALVLSLFFMFVYNALAIPLVFSFLSIALLWRNQREVLAAGDQVDPAPGLTARALDRR
jgi:hypothetical protein